ncbi:MAG TPA: hypothetical protein VHY08_10265 [Bacillota bacterium]|nr:hypothetical protein [Bacillota bacterium]
MAKSSPVVVSKNKTKKEITPIQNQTPGLDKQPLTQYEQLLYLQRTVGNRAAIQLVQSGYLRSSSLQTKSGEKPSSTDADARPRETQTQTANSPLPVQPAPTHLTLVSAPSHSERVQLKGEDEKSNSSWIMDKVGGLIRNIPGYDVLTLVIGRDPITGQEVKREGVAFVKAIVGLVPGGKAMFENLEKAGVISRVVDWFKVEFQKLNLSFSAIKELFNQALEAIIGRPKQDEGFFSNLGRSAINVGKSLLSPTETFNKLKHIFLGPIQRIMNFLGSAGSKLMQFVFEGALTLAGAPVNMIMGTLNKGKEVLNKIISDPIGFLKNLLSAVQGGLSKFVANIVTHLQNGIGGWLFGTLGKAGITLPKKLDLAGIFHVAAQVLGVTWEGIKGLVAKKLGPIADQVMGVVEKTVGFVVTFIDKGPMALLEMAQDFLGELKTLFFDSLIEWVRNTIIVKAVEQLISMFSPVGAIIQAVITIYNTIQFFIERAKQIAAFVNAVFDSIAEIAGGNIGKAVDAVEDALAKGVPVAISFLATLLKLGGITKKIQEIIKTVRKPIDKVIGKVVGFIVEKAKAIWAKMVSAGKNVVEGVKDKVGAIAAWWKIRKGFTTKNGEDHSVYFEGQGKNAELMVASDETPLKKFLARNEVQSLKSHQDGKKHFTEINRLMGLIKKDIDGQNTALTKAYKGDQAEDKTNQAMDENMTLLGNELQWIMGELGNGMPQSDPYNKLEGKYEGYTPHHVPPKGLANWISQKVKKASRVLKGTEYEDIRKAGIEAGKEHDSNAGANLECILIHQNTHISKTGIDEIDDYRVHHGKETSKQVAEILKEKGITPIMKKGELVYEEDEIEDAINEKQQGKADQGKVGTTSTQFYLSQLDAAMGEVEKKDVETYLGKIRDVFKRAYHQAFAAVSVALKQSGAINGTEAKKNTILDGYNAKAKTTWHALHPGMEKITDFTDPK